MRLIFFMEHKSQLVVLDPFSAAAGGGTDVIRLPPFTNRLFKYVDEVILSREPCLGSSFEVLATCRYSDVVARLVDGDHQLNWSYSEKTRDYYTYNFAFIVETTNGELVMVGRSRKQIRNYKIFKIMDSNGQLDLSPVVDLGVHSLFLEKHHSLSVMASNYPGSCRPNTIYYVCSEKLLYHGTFEEFNLEDQSLHVDVKRFSMPEGSWIVSSMKP